MSCEFCTGSFYLDDNRALGPCVCATTEALLEAIQEHRASDDVIWSVLGQEADGQAVAEAVRDCVTDQAEALERAGDGLRAYLVKTGRPANPVTLDDPDLMAMADALF